MQRFEKNTVVAIAAAATVRSTTSTESAVQVDGGVTDGVLTVVERKALLPDSPRVLVFKARDLGAPLVEGDGHPLGVLVGNPRHLGVHAVVLGVRDARADRVQGLVVNAGKHLGSLVKANWQ